MVCIQIYFRVASCCSRDLTKRASVHFMKSARWWKTVDEVIGPHSTRSAPSTIKCFSSSFYPPSWFIWMHSPMTFRVDYDHFISHVCVVQHEHYRSSVSSRPDFLAHSLKGCFALSIERVNSLAVHGSSRVREGKRNRRMGNINLIYFYYDEFHWAKEAKMYKYWWCSIDWESNYQGTEHCF